MSKELSTKAWDGFLGGAGFLKAEDIENEDQAFVCVDVEISDDDRPRLSLQHNEKTYTFDLNVTNANAVHDAGVETPNQCIGKKIYFRKVVVTSPKTKKEVEALRIRKVE